MSQPNWLGLLQWSLAYSDGTSASNHTQMNEEDKAWLERVLKEGVRDDPARMNELMLQLQAILDREPNESDEEVIEAALEEIKEIVEQIDMAQVFTKFGGVKCLIRIIHNVHINDELKALAASVIGTIAQNNLIVQDILYRDEVISELMRVYAATDSPLLCTKILYSVSCAVRNHAAMEELFVQAFASTGLSKAFASNHEPLLLRAVFLSNALLTSDNTSNRRIQLLTDLIVPAVFNKFSHVHLDLHENIIRLFTSLLHTAYGHQLLTSAAHSAAVESALVSRTEVLRNGVSDGSITEEESAHNASLLSGVRALLTEVVSVRYPATPIASVAPAATPAAQVVTNSDDIQKANAAAPPSPVLMIGAPSTVANNSPTN